MTSVLHRSRIAYYLLVGLLGAGCAPGTTLRSPATVPPPTVTVRAIGPTETPLATVEPATATVVAPASTAAGPVLQLTFVSGVREGHYEINAIDVHCLEAREPCLGKPRLLMDQNKRIDAVDWSPDGKRVVFRAEGWLFLANWNGEDVSRIPTSPGSGAWPQWSPDGSKIAFIFNAARPGSAALGPSQIRVYDLETQ